MLNGLIRFKQILLLPLAVIVVFVVPALAASVLVFADVGQPLPPSVGEISVPSDPVEINQLISFTASYTEPGGFPVTAVWDWGDGTTSAGTVEDNDTVTGGHTYNDPGVYTVLLKVTSEGTSDSGEASSPPVVVFDPAGGFVTGGGWINSPPEACPNFCGGAEDKANFGFVSKYKKGASEPTGQTEFQFKAGDLNFHSDEYDWLVVNQGGSNAQFKGEGTINGGLAPNNELFKFMIWAGDGDPDTFRIRIWWEEADGTEYDVYDNGPDRPIGGGNIVIHKAK